MGKHRLVSALAVGVLLGGLRAVAPEGAARTHAFALLALPLGYGHLLGGLWFARRRLAARLPTRAARVPAAALALVSVANLLALYGLALRSPAAAPWVLGALLLVSLWHIAENDLALARAQPGDAASAGLAHRPRDIVLALCLVTGIAGAACATPEGAWYASRWLGADAPLRAPFDLEELTSAILLYHAASWLRFAWLRARPRDPTDRGRSRRQRRDLVGVHALPLVANAVLFWSAPDVHAQLASPALYLFWSVLHAVQTASVRVRGPAARPWATA